MQKLVELDMIIGHDLQHRVEKVAVFLVSAGAGARQPLGALSND